MINKITTILQKTFYFILILVSIYIVTLLIGLGASFLFNFNFKEVLLFEGLIFTFIGFATSIGGDPLGLCFQGFSSLNSQHTSEAILQLKETNEPKTSLITKPSINISSVSLFFLASGILAIVSNLFIY